MMKHVFQCHSGAPNFSYQCGSSGCIQTFRTYSAMTSHLQRKHPNYDGESSLESVSQDPGEMLSSSGLAEERELQFDDQGSYPSSSSTSFSNWLAQRST